MIEVNLVPGAKKDGATKVAGIDVGLINIKMVVISIILLYSYEAAIDFVYGDQVAVLEEQARENNKKHRELSSELAKNQAIKDKVKVLDAQEATLASKISVVKEIVDKRSNPFEVLKYIAENTPDYVWLHELEIENNKLTMTGQSKSFKKLGDFIENLKNSIFFDGNINYTKPENIKSSINGIRVEPFKLQAQIVRQK